MTEAGEAMGYSLNTCIFWLWKVGIVITLFIDGEVRLRGME